jgi:hypothetical protein
MRLRALLEQQARQERIVQTARQEELVAEAKEARALEQARVDAAAPQRRLHMVLSQCRFTPEDLDKMNAMFTGDARFTQAKVAAKRSSMQKAPPPPLPAVQACLEARESTEVARAIKRPTAAWAKLMCRYRDLFKDTALLIHQEDGSVLAYKFIFAFQSPMVAIFAPMVWLSDQGVAVGEMGPASYQAMLPDYCPLQFKLDPLRIRVDQELPIEDVGDVDVVPGLFYMTHERLGTQMRVSSLGWRSPSTCHRGLP